MNYYVIKAIKIEKYNKNELIILEKLMAENNDFIVKCYGYVPGDEYMHIIMEYCN